MHLKLSYQQAKTIRQIIRQIDRQIDRQKLPDNHKPEIYTSYSKERKGSRHNTKDSHQIPREKEGIKHNYKKTENKLQKGNENINISNLFICKETKSKDRVAEWIPKNDLFACCL